MATVAVRQYVSGKPEVAKAKDFPAGSLLVHVKSGNVTLRTAFHVIREGGADIGSCSVLVLELNESSDDYTLAPKGSYLTFAN